MTVAIGAIRVNNGILHDVTSPLGHAVGAGQRLFPCFLAGGLAVLNLSCLGARECPVPWFVPLSRVVESSTHRPTFQTISTSSTVLGIVIWPSDNPMKSLILKRSERGLSVVRGYSPGYRGSSKALSIASGGVQGSKLGFFQPLRRQDLAKLRVPGVRMRGSRRCPGKQVPCLTLADRS